MNAIFAIFGVIMVLSAYQNKQGGGANLGKSSAQNEIHGGQLKCELFSEDNLDLWISQTQSGQSQTVLFSGCGGLF